LNRLAFEKGWNRGALKEPSVAVTVKEKESEKPLLILFSTFDITKDEVNTALKECGYGRIVKIAEVRKLPEIPVTGTGKTHYRLLDEI
jgi:long-chain-fatty-acid--[acyl-carrier-protein] ligase